MFKCPYSDQPLDRACGVGSCNFHMDGPLAPGYRHCFLNYLESLKHNPYGNEELERNPSFGELSSGLRRQIVKALFGADDPEVDRAYGAFYLAMFNITAQDVIAEQEKSQVEPVPYRQCAVCGIEADLWIPKRGALPPGYGYCGYACYQRKPPPLLALERRLELEVGQLFHEIEFNGPAERPKFIKQLAGWVLGESPMT